MYTTYHLTSAQDANAEILDAIKSIFKSKPITITVEEDYDDLYLTPEMKNVLDERLQENERDCLSAEASIKQLHLRYGI